MIMVEGSWEGDGMRIGIFDEGLCVWIGGRGTAGGSGSEWNWLDVVSF